jgi:hypothetical protein
MRHPYFTTRLLALALMMGLSSVALDAREQYDQLFGQMEERFFSENCSTNPVEFDRAMRDLERAFEESADSRNPETSAHVRAWQKQLRLAFKARNGDADAFEELKLSKPETLRPVFLRFVGDMKARDALAAIAADVSQPMEMRLRSVFELGELKDKRAVEIGLSEEFIKAKEAEWGPKEIFLTHYLLDITGQKETNQQAMAELSAIKTVEEARQVLLPAGKDKIRIESGAKPRRVQISKAEKPVAATLPPKPPANKTGTLIAAGAAIVGLLAVLFWFLRKK